MEGLVVLVGATGFLIGMLLTALWNKMAMHYYWENRGKIWNAALTMQQIALSSIKEIEESLEQLDQSIQILNDRTLEVLIGTELGLVKARVKNLRKKIPVNENAELSAQVRKKNVQLSEYGEMFAGIWQEAMEIRNPMESIARQVEAVRTDHSVPSIAETSVS